MTTQAKSEKHYLPPPQKENKVIYKTLGILLSRASHFFCYKVEITGY
jgi:hypothetical protein